jgi:hypothetical protein
VRRRVVTWAWPAVGGWHVVTKGTAASGDWWVCVVQHLGVQRLGAWIVANIRAPHHHMRAAGRT